MFRNQLAAGRITSLADVPEFLDSRARELLADPVIHASLGEWLEVDAALGEDDGRLLHDGDMSHERWNGMLRRMEWLTGYANAPLTDQLRSREVGYLEAFYATTIQGGTPFGVDDLDLEDVHTRVQLAGADFPINFANGLYVLSNESIGGDLARLPEPVRDAAESDDDSAERTSLGGLLLGASNADCSGELYREVFGEAEEPHYSCVIPDGES